MRRAHDPKVTPPASSSQGVKPSASKDEGETSDSAATTDRAVVAVDDAAQLAETQAAAMANLETLTVAGPESAQATPTEPEILAGTVFDNRYEIRDAVGERPARSAVHADFSEHPREPASPDFRAVRRSGRGRLRADAAEGAAVESAQSSAAADGAMPDQIEVVGLGAAAYLVCWGGLAPGRRASPAFEHLVGLIELCPQQGLTFTHRLDRESSLHRLDA